METLYDSYSKAYLKILLEPHAAGVLHPAAWISEEWEVNTEFMVQESDAKERLQALAEEDGDLFTCVIAGMNMRMNALGRPKRPNGLYDCHDLYVSVEEAQRILRERDW